MVCGLHRKEVENGVVLVCEKTNGWCKLWGLIKHNELGDMGHFVPMKKEIY
jgi:hypothetical protein